MTILKYTGTNQLLSKWSGWWWCSPRL